MNNQFNELNKNIYNNFGSSYQKLIELNLKTAQNISYVNPLELLSPEPKKPMETFIHNSLILNNYLRETFNILTAQWVNITPSIAEKSKKIVKEASSMMEKNAQNAAKLAKKATPMEKKSTVKKNKPESSKNVTGNEKDKYQANSDKLQSNTLHVKPKAQQLPKQRVGSINKNGSISNKSNKKDLT